MKNKKHSWRNAAALAVSLIMLFSLSMPVFAFSDGAEQKDETGLKTEKVTEKTEKIGTVTTNGGRLNVRDGAGINNPIIGQLTSGDTVTVTGEENGWYKVVVPKKEGYVCGDYLTVSDEKLTQTKPSKEESGENKKPLTPDGNLELVDDVTQESDGKQFITVQSKNDNTFYIVIDREKDNENVYFMNLVDEADLMSLMQDGEVTVKCTCKKRCEAGNVDMNCPVCKSNLTECIGAEEEKAPTPAEPEPTEKPEPEPEEKASNSAPLLLILLIAGLGAGGAVYYLKFKKKKPDTKGPVDLDDYDFGDEEDDDVEYVTEDEETDEHDDSDEE